MISWGNDIKEYALQQAQSGVHFDGWKIVEGRSNRKFTDEAAVAFKVKDAGYDPYEKKLLGITAMSTLLGKKKFEELLGELVYKPPVLLHLASWTQTVSLSLRDQKYIPVFTAELPSISMLSTAMVTKVSPAGLIISRRLETVSLLVASPELKMISLPMKMTISLINSNVTMTTKQAVVILLPPVTILESR